MKVFSVGTRRSFVRGGWVKVEITEKEFNALWSGKELHYIEEIPCNDFILKECFCTSVTANINPNLPRFSAEYIFNDTERYQE